MHPQVQMVCVSQPVGSQGTPLDFLLKPAPSSWRNRNQRKLVLNRSPSSSFSLRRRASSSSPPDRPHLHPSPRAPLPSFLNLLDTPSPTSTTLPELGNCSTAHLPREPAFLQQDPYSSTLHSTTCIGNRLPPRDTQLVALETPRQPSPTVLDSAFPSRPKLRRHSVSATSIFPSKSLRIKGSASSLLRTLMASSSSASSHSSVSSSATVKSKSRKAPEKILPFTTQQIAELDRLMGNPKAAKGKVPSQFASGSHAPSEDKHYIAPYVPLNGSAPSGTRSFGRDGERHPIGAPSGTTQREVGTGNALPYMRDESGQLWSGQEEVDEFQTLIPEQGKRRKATSKIDTRRRGSEDEWRAFTPASASSIDSSRSALRSAGSSDVFDLGYDDRVMVPEGGAIGLNGSSTFGSLARGGPQTVAHSTRGVESFPAPEVTFMPSSEPRAKGTSRRRPVTPVISHGASVSSLGTIQPHVPLDKAGKTEFFSDAFTPAARPAPLPLQDSNHAAFESAPSPKSRLHRHSTSLAVGSANFFANLVGKEQPMSPISPTSPGYLPPLPGAAAYTGIRQSSFSGPCSPSTYKPGREPSRLGSRPPVVGMPEQQVKKKASGLNVANMFRKLGMKA